METKRLSEYQIVEVVSKSKMTSKVKVLTSIRQETITVKNVNLKEDPIVILTQENAVTARLIMQVAHPEYGVQPFHYQSQRLTGSDSCHTWGVGSNGACLFDSEMHFWRVIA